MCFFLTTFHFDSENRTSSIGEITLKQSMVRMFRQGRVIYFLDLRMIFQMLHHFQRILYMTFHTQ